MRVWLRDPDGAPPGGGLDREDELRSLRRWLDEDESLDGALHTRLASGTRTRPGEMGTIIDVLSLAIGSGLSSGALAVSLLQWRDARRTRRTVVLRRGEIEIEIPATGPRDDGALARVIAGLLAPAPVPGSPPLPVPAPAPPPAAAPPAPPAPPPPRPVGGSGGEGGDGDDRAEPA